MKLWIDECLSPTLVERANCRGYWATCNRDRNLLGISDRALHLLFDAALDHVERQAKAAGETSVEWMLNKRVEIDLSGTATNDDLPGIRREH